MMVRHIIKRYYSSKLSYIRNIGIIAHIDAGKTTTTERMLFYSGYMSHVGEVHRGNTVMDYLDQERERGITITSAAITFPWKKHQINLIDTPGHVDFTLEVERAVRVLDGGVVILDGSAGVEAQTVTVWRQAERHNLPRIAFINKMDKPNANFEMTLQSMEKKLQVVPLVVELPVLKDSKHTGVVDLVHMKCHLWSKSDTSGGKKFEITDVSPDTNLADDVAKYRAEMLEKLCDFDETLAEIVIGSGDYDSLQTQDIQSALRRVTLANDNNAIVTLCGSAYKNFGIQTLLDAIVSYLPSPDEKSFPFLKYYRDEFCGLAFKMQHHPQKGALTFVRIYSGTLREGDSIFNSSQMCAEKFSKLMVAFADDYKSVSEVTAGNIAVISGLKNTSTGDSLVHSSSLAKSVMKEWESSDKSGTSPSLPGVQIPDPVFYCSIEPPSLKDQKQLELALTNLSKEDPSLRVKFDPDTGQTVLSGMGELHLEIVKDRILKEYKVDAELGALMIAYKETVQLGARESVKFTRVISDKTHNIEIDIEVQPMRLEPGQVFKESQFKMVQTRESQETWLKLKPWQLKAIKTGFSSAVAAGPLLDYPVINSKFLLHNIQISPGTSDTMISSGMMEAVKNVMSAGESRLLEPIMRLEISVDKDKAAAVSQDLLRKRGLMLETEERDSQTRLMIVEAPLAELRGYSSHVRIISSGRALFGMEFSHYQLMDEEQQVKAIEDVTGFAS